jgi:hypothetical protein
MDQWLVAIILNPENGANPYRPGASWGIGINVLCLQPFLLIYFDRF